jgi:hypothetical protein
MITVVRTSMISGQSVSMNLDITQAQIDAYDSGALVQDAFPNLDRSQREFFKSGITSEEWDELYE